MTEIIKQNWFIILLLGLLDTLLYGYLWEKKHYKWAVGGVVWESTNYGLDDIREIIPVYRVFMFLLECLGAWIVYSSLNIIWQFDFYHIIINLYRLFPLWAYFACLYFPVKDVIYYAANWQLEYIVEQKGNHLYWVEHWFQAGYWMFKEGFAPKWFFVSGIAFFVIAIITNFI